jgi:hypothetical protein
VGAESPTERLLREMVATPGVPGGAELEVGAIVDAQYRIDAPIGRGGMGAVYRARDLELDRDVALKIGTAVSESALLRVQREAIALAKLQHPNVVTVHQVGRLGGRVYIAMEFVAGGNAREWLAARRAAKPAKRDWRAIVQLYAAAGDGLAAAHAAGFIHRDFKPDNVLVGEDARPRVADFGLVRTTTTTGDPEAAVTTPGSPLNVAVTRADAVMGTPAYMAPEQLSGGAVDERCDQYSFCVSVWEALFGVRPFMDDAKPDADPQPPPELARAVPRRIAAALRRGLQLAPAARWPSMASLVAELRRDPGRMRRTIALVAGALVAIAAAIVIPIATADKRDPCADGKRLIAETWNAPRVEVLRAAFERVGLAPTWITLKGAVDKYASRWKSAHRAACRQSRVEGSQSEAMLDRRMLCLARARMQLDSTLTMLAADREALAKAPQVMQLLPDLASCSNVLALSNQPELPAGSAARAKIEAAAKLVDEAKTASNEGWTRDPQALGARALAAAREAGWPPLVAEALVVDANLGGGASLSQLDEAAAAALATGDDRTAAFALADAAEALAGRGTVDDAAIRIGLARALWTRLAKPDDLAARIEEADAARLGAAGDVIGAVAATRRANAFGERAFPDNPFDRATAHYNLGLRLLHANQLGDAQRELDEALAIAKQLAGEHHPMLGGFLVAAAQVADRRGRRDDAIAYARRALAIYETWYGTSDPRIAWPLDGLGQLLALGGQLDEARRTLARAHAVDPDARFADPEPGRALLEARARNYALAIEIGTPALARYEREHRANINAAELLLTLGISHREVGHLDESRRLLERLVAITSAAVGADAAQTLNAKVELARTLVASKQAADARALLEPMFAIAAAPPAILAEAHAVLAAARFALGDRPGARRDGEAARDGYAALGDGFKDELAGAEKWLREHP